MSKIFITRNFNFVQANIIRDDCIPNYSPLEMLILDFNTDYIIYLANQRYLNMKKYSTNTKRNKSYIFYINHIIKNPVILVHH